MLLHNQRKLQNKLKKCRNWWCQLKINQGYKANPQISKLRVQIGLFSPLTPWGLYRKKEEGSSTIFCSKGKKKPPSRMHFTYKLLCLWVTYCDLCWPLFLVCLFWNRKQYGGGLVTKKSGMTAKYGWVSFVFFLIPLLNC